MRTEASVEIDRPIDEVFRLTTNHVPEWSIVVVEEEVIEEHVGGVGTICRTVTEDRGRKMEFRTVVTRYDPPHVNAIEMTGKSFDIDCEYRFEDLSGRTRVTQTSSVRGKGLFKVFLMLFGWMMNKSSCDAAAKELNSLKQYCESRSDTA